MSNAEMLLTVVALEKLTVIDVRALDTHEKQSTEI